MSATAIECGAEGATYEQTMYDENGIPWVYTDTGTHIADREEGAGEGAWVWTAEGVPSKGHLRKVSNPKTFALP